MMNIFVMKAYAHSQLYPHHHPHGVASWDVDLVLSLIFCVLLTVFLLWLVRTQFRRIK